MRKISSGEPSTLGTYRNIALVLSRGYEKSKAVKYFDKLIKKAKNGEDEEVIAPESQMLYLIVKMIGEDIVND